MTVESNNRPAVPGGMPGNAATLVQAVAALPAGATWSATGVGRAMLGVPDRH
jgi:uncharacterized protein (DUF849 family)